MSIPSVRWKKGTYEARVRLNGKLICGYGPNEQDALESLLAKIERLEMPSAGQSLKSYTENTYLSQKLTLNYKRQIRWAIDSFPYAHLPLAELNRQQIQSSLDVMTISPTSVKRIRSILHAVFELACADGLIEANPAHRVKVRQRAPKKETRTCTAEELQKLIRLAHANNSSALPTLVLTGLMGLGWEEIRNLKVKPGVLQVEIGKNESRPRTLPVPGKITQLLKECKPPFIPRSDSSALKAVARVCEKAGLPVAGRHVLRHTCSTLLQEIGCPVEVRSMILGHTLKGMAGHYSHGQMMKQKSEWLNKLVDAVLTVQVGETVGDAVS